MTLFQRKPSPVYRVYEEDEYLQDETGTSEAGRGEAESPDGDDARSRLRPTALVSVGLILAVAAIAATLILSSAARRASRRPATASALAAGATRGRDADAARPRAQREPHPPLRANRIARSLRLAEARVTSPRASRTPLASPPDGDSTAAAVAEFASLSPPYDTELRAAQRAGGEFGFER